MKKVAIFTDNLMHANSIVNQLNSISKKYDIDLEVECIFYLGESGAGVRNERLKEIENLDIGIKIKSVDLYYLSETLDEFYVNDGLHMLIMKWGINDDIPIRRANVRYFRSKTDPDSIWFYTGMGKDMQNTINELTNNHLIVMKSCNYRAGVMELELEENEAFMYDLRKKENFKVKSKIHR